MLLGYTISTSSSSPYVPSLQSTSFPEIHVHNPIQTGALPSQHILHLEKVILEAKNLRVIIYIFKKFQIIMLF